MNKIISIAAVTLLLLSCKQSKQTISFQSMEPENIGIDFIHDNGHVNQYNYKEFLGAGVAVIDYDLDGDLDLYFVQSGKGLKSDQMYKSLLIETGQLTFKNVTKELGLNQSSYGVGVAIGDYNNDGFPDIYLSNWKQNTLLKNNGGQYFEDVTQVAQLMDQQELSVIATFVDLDQDGWQDIISLNNIAYTENNQPTCTLSMGVDYCGPESFDYEKNNIYRNNHGVFEKVTSNYSSVDSQLPSLAITSFDANLDGLIDFYIANDEQVNTLWINQGHFKFKNQALTSGLAVNGMAKPEASMGIALGDVSQNGLFDLYLSHMRKESNTFYQQDAVGQFVDTTAKVKLSQSSLPHTGFGIQFIDFENDGDLDMAVANGSVSRMTQNYNYDEDNLFYENHGEITALLSNDVILTKNNRNNSRGLIRADLNNDGYSDFVISNNNAHPEIYINTYNKINNWIGFTAVNKWGNTIENIESTVQYQSKIIHMIQSRSGSYASSADPRNLVGLGQYKSEVTIVVRWNINQYERFSLLEVNSYHKLIKGTGESVESWPIKIQKYSPLKVSLEASFESSIKALLKSSQSNIINNHIKSYEVAKPSNELCLILHSYEYISQASLCYQLYFKQNKISTNSDLYYLAGLNEVNIFNYSKAHSYFEKAIKLNASEQMYCIRKAQTSLLEKKLKLAFSELKLCKKNKENIFIEKLLGDVYFQQQDYKNSFKKYRKVILKNPNARYLYYKLSESLKGLNKPELAELALKKAGDGKLRLHDTIFSQLIHYNKDPEFHYQKALVAKQNNNIQEAIIAVKVALSIESHNEKYLTAYALLLARINKIHNALVLLQKNKEYIRSAKSHLIYATLLTKANQITQAQNVYLSALKKFPNNVDILTNFANNNLRLNKKEQAIQSYLTILRLDKDNINALRGLEQLKYKSNIQ